MAIGRKSLLGDGLGAVKVSEPGKVSSDLARGQVGYADGWRCLTDSGRCRKRNQEPGQKPVRLMAYRHVRFSLLKIDCRI